MRSCQLVVALSAVSAALGVGASPARAAPPDDSRSSGSDSFVTTRTCSDPVRVDSQWSVIIHAHYDAAGDETRVQYTGTIRITFTDLGNGNSYSPNSSGPSTFDPVSGETAVRGSNAAVFNSDGVLVSTSGRILYDADSNIISIVGNQRPVCAALGTTPYTPSAGA